MRTYKELAELLEYDTRPITKIIRNQRQMNVIKENFMGTILIQGRCDLEVKKTYPKAEIIVYRNRHDKNIKAGSQMVRVLAPNTLKAYGANVELKADCNIVAEDCYIEAWGNSEVVIYQGTLMTHDQVKAEAYDCQLVTAVGDSQITTKNCEMVVSKDNANVEICEVTEAKE